MDKRNWMQISHTLIQRYKIYSLYSTIKSLPLQIFHTAVSSFSGPIALLLDKNITHQFILPQSLTNSLLILNCKGELMKAISYNYKDRIVFIGFTGIEELLVVEASGDYWLIDAFSGQIVQGNYSAKEDKQEKYRGCELMLSGGLVMIRDKQLGATESLTSTWEPISELKIKVENPMFCAVYGSQDQFIYLTRQHAIQMYNLTQKKKSTIYSDSYLNENWQNLLAMSYNKEKNLLGLAFRNPSILFYIDLQTNSHKRLDAMIELKYDLSSSNTPGLTYKYISKSFYKPTGYTLSWLNGKFDIDQDLESLQTSILVFGNPKLLLMYDGKSTRLTPRSNCNQLISVQLDCIRVYTEDSHEIYRIVPYLYQTIIEINKISEGYYRDRFKQIIQLHDQYTNYLEKDIIDLSKLDGLWKMGDRCMPAQDAMVEGNGEKEEDQEVGNFYLNKENTDDVKEKIQKIEDAVIRPLIRCVRYCIDPVDQVKMLKFIFFVKNLYTCPIDIYELCYQMRIVNNLKFEFLSRTLTINEFDYLKYEAKDRFLTILLRYRMHFIGDTIFKDSESKYKIFLHWAKCKIEKNNETIAFEEIKQKFQNTPKKLRSSKVFTDIAKYSLDRGKLGLADKIIELEENPERKIMVYLLMLTSTTDKKVVQKLLNAAEECTRSFLIFRVIRELIEATWIETHAWVNILYEKPNVARHYIRYLKAHGKQQLLKNYFFQNKDYENLGYYGVERMFDVGKGQEPEIPKYSEEVLEAFIPKVEELKKFLPNLSSVTKSYIKNVQMDLLRKAKSGDYMPTEDDLRLIKNDQAFQYLGEILYQKEKIEAAVSALKKIKSDRVYNILMRKQRFRDAIEVAAQRKSRQALLEIKLKCPAELEDLVEEKLQGLTKK